jgi:hypothetical protein
MRSQGVRGSLRALAPLAGSPSDQSVRSDPLKTVAIEHTIEASASSRLPSTVLLVATTRDHVSARKRTIASPACAAEHS